MKNPLPFFLMLSLLFLAGCAGARPKPVEAGPSIEKLKGLTLEQLTSVPLHPEVLGFVQTPMANGSAEYIPDDLIGLFVVKAQGGDLLRTPEASLEQFARALAAAKVSPHRLKYVWTKYLSIKLATLEFDYKDVRPIELCADKARLNEVIDKIEAEASLKIDALYAFRLIAKGEEARRLKNREVNKLRYGCETGL